MALMVGKKSKAEYTTQKGDLTDSNTTQKNEITTQKDLDATQKKVLEY